MSAVPLCEGSKTAVCTWLTRATVFMVSYTGKQLTPCRCTTSVEGANGRGGIIPSALALRVGTALVTPVGFILGLSDS